MATVTRFLLATDSVHTTAAACDYLEGRLSTGDEVSVLAVAEGNLDRRDVEDALNVVTVRLSGLASVETATAEGDAAAAILATVDDGHVDEIVIGARSGSPGTDVAVGETARTVLDRANVPVVVVPLPRLQ